MNSDTIHYVISGSSLHAGLGAHCEHQPFRLEEGRMRRAYGTTCKPYTSGPCSNARLVVILLVAKCVVAI